MGAEAPATEGYVPANLLRLHYRERGPVDAPVVLFLHGVTGHAGMWDSISAALLSEFRCISLDFRGYGQSDWSPGGAYDRSDHAADVAAVAQVLGLARFSLVGFSLGGAVALLYAAEHPESVERLVVVDTGAELPSGMRAPRHDIAPLPDAFPDVDAAVAWSRKLDLYARADPRWLRSYFAEGLTADDDGALKWRFDRRIRQRLGAPGRTPAAPLWYLLPSIACPTLLVRGVESPNMGMRMAQRMLAAIPDCRMAQ
ncbi:MAG: alpha/beta hydrolase, partial [Chloroflexi bacterium]|nr:alpha/beta hydrolase [Chloroflexota bacterium]